tara:strand:- start:172 stop:675 length:504 start_codon:yes stop_codon:yes gene_type:complete
MNIPILSWFFGNTSDSEDSQLRHQRKRDSDIRRVDMDIKSIEDRKKHLLFEMHGAFIEHLQQHEEQLEGNASDKAREALKEHLLPLKALKPNKTERALGDFPRTLEDINRRFLKKVPCSLALFEDFVHSLLTIVGQERNLLQRKLKLLGIEEVYHDQKRNVEDALAA